MPDAQNKPPLVMLGEMYSDIKWLRSQAEAAALVDKDHEARLGSLEKFKFKLVFVVASVGALFGFLVSNVKDGVEWLKQTLQS